MSRLDKTLADLGIGSRAEVKKWIRWGWITVDGELIKDPKTHVALTAALCIKDELLVRLPPLAVFHKPSGVHSTLRDQWGRASLATAVPPEWRQHHPVGRLDAETTGLLLLSTDGQFTQRVLHPKRAVEREYIALVSGDPVTERSVELLAAGVRTSLGVFSARVVEFDALTVRLVVTEGKNRMVRRILANIGHPVTKLHRCRYGAVELGDLPAGEARAATPAELEWMVDLMAGTAGAQ